MNVFQKMLKFEPNDLLLLYSEFYLSEYGTVKTATVHQKTLNVSKLETYLMVIINNAQYPTMNDILSCLNTSTYFIFSKHETLCFGAIVSINYWYDAMKKFQQVDNSRVTKLIVDVIQKCDSMKLQHPNFFNRFYTLIKSIN